MKKWLLTYVCLCTIEFFGVAQEYSFDSINWEIKGDDLIEDVARFFEGRNSLYLSRTQAVLKDFEFFKGVIEFDVFVTESRGFPGIVFRMVDENNYEEFYIRPHQSSNPDANQYTPVFNGRAAWQLYYGEEFSKPYSYKFNTWNKVKFIIAESDAEVYINDMNNPLYYIPELKHGSIRGSVGLRNSGPSGFYFSNFRVQNLEKPVLKSRTSYSMTLESGTVTEWLVSTPFKEKDIADKFNLDQGIKQGLTWKKIGVENKGYANLLRLNGVSAEVNTVFAKLSIESDSDQIKRLSYGFSDRVRIYLNDEIVAGGQDGYASRDYRFLGTMGFFDDVYLKLKRGRNELMIAVSESFGGWGIMGKFDDLSGIELKD